VAKHEGKLDLNWAQAAGSSLAALSSAVLLSTLGATGTLIGAALGSLVVTVGGTLYSHYLSASRERVAVARQAALRRARAAGSAQLVTAGGPMTGGRPVAPQEPPQPTPTSTVSVSWRDAVRRVRWKPVLAVSAGVFVLVIGVIVSMELVTGRALSSYTGGTSADGPRTSISLLGSDRSRDFKGTGGAATTEDRSEPDTDGRTNLDGASSGEGSGTGSDDGSDSDDTDQTEQTDQTDQTDQTEPTELGDGTEPTTAPDSGTSEPTAEPEPEPTTEPEPEPTTPDPQTIG
jgi:hypothetical protein